MLRTDDDNKPGGRVVAATMIGVAAGVVVMGTVSTDEGRTASSAREVVGGIAAACLE